MIRAFASVASLFLGGAAFCAPAEAFQLEGARFRTDASISCTAPTKDLPQAVIIYKVLPQQFSNEIVSRMLKIADFSPAQMRLSADKKTMQWRHRDENGTLTRSLDIAPSLGAITYFNTKTEAPSSRQAEGVPSFDEVDRLALDYLGQLGCDTNQLALRPVSRTDNHRTLYKKRGGELIMDDFTSRGGMYTRKIDGLLFNGHAGRGGLWIEFGDHAKVARLDLNWRTLRPYQRYRAATSKQIIKSVRAGRATLPEQDVDPNVGSEAKKLTITQITPHYWGDAAGTDQHFVYPFAQLSVTADLEGTNKTSFDLFCPIIEGVPIEENRSPK
jgi:hypothetical protein